MDRLMGKLNGKKDMLDEDWARLEEELKWRDDELNDQLRQAGNNYDMLKELEMKLKLQKEEADRLRKDHDDK